MNYQYFVQIVPTDIQTLIGSWPAFQYSVKEQAREVGNYAMGSSGIPGKINKSVIDELAKKTSYRLMITPFAC